MFRKQYGRDRHIGPHRNGSAPAPLLYLARINCAKTRARMSGVCRLVVVVALVGSSWALAQEPASPYYHAAHLLVRFKPAIGAIARQEAHGRARGLRVLVNYHIVDGLQLVEVPHRKMRTAVNA